MLFNQTSTPLTFIFNKLRMLKCVNYAISYYQLLMKMGPLAILVCICWTMLIAPMQTTACEQKCMDDDYKQGKRQFLSLRNLNNAITNIATYLHDRIGPTTTHPHRRRRSWNQRRTTPRSSYFLQALTTLLVMQTNTLPTRQQSTYFDTDSKQIGIDN